MPSRPSPRRITELVAEITERRHAADDPHRDQLGGNLMDILDYLRKHPAAAPEHALADGLAALELRTEIRWWLAADELSGLDRLDALPEAYRPTNRAVASLLGITKPQSVRDRRDRHRALLTLGKRSEHLVREQRRAERDRQDTVSGLHQARARLLAIDGIDAFAAASTAAAGWLTEVRTDHAAGTAGATARTILRVAAVELVDLLDDIDADGDSSEPGGLRDVLDCIHHLPRASSR